MAASIIALSSAWSGWNYPCILHCIFFFLLLLLWFSEVRSEPAVLALIALATIILLSVMRITCSLLRLRFQVSASLHHFLERIGLGEDNVTGQVQTVQHDLLLGLQVCKLLLLIVFQFGLLRWRRVCGQRL